MGFLDSFFGGGKNPADAAMPYLNQIPGATSGYFQPYINAGQSAIPQLQEQYKDLLNNPGGKLNSLGGLFDVSPGVQAAIKQALHGSNNAAAAGGLAGSPQHEQQNMQLATDLTNQDYYNYLDRVLGLYGGGLSGTQGLAQQGLQAGTSMADMIAQTLAQQGNMAFRGQQEKNSQNNSFLGGLGQLGGAALGGIAGGPWGAFLGYNMAK